METRWKLRFENLKDAFAQLEKGCEQEEYNDLELAGLVQTFNFTFELNFCKPVFGTCSFSTSRR